MDFKEPFWLAFLSSYLLLTWSVYRHSNTFDETLKDESKISISNWLIRSSNSNEFRNLPSYFLELFDKFFSKKTFSLKRISRSIIASFISLFILLIVFLSLNYDEWVINQEEFPIYGAIIGIFIAGMIFNLIPDYISIIETRFAIKLMGSSDSFIIWLFILIVDIILTAAIFILFFPIASNSIVPIQYLVNKEPYQLYREFFYVIIDGIFFRGSFPITGIFFYSTFFTSIWLWLYFISSVAVRTLSIFKPTAKFFVKHFKIETHPIRVLGLFICFFITGLYLIWAVFLLF